jgi:hypothetical protein
MRDPVDDGDVACGLFCSPWVGWVENGGVKTGDRRWSSHRDSGWPGENGRVRERRRRNPRKLNRGRTAAGGAFRSFGAACAFVDACAAGSAVAVAVDFEWEEAVCLER